jgi:hypothetical protein
MGETGRPEELDVVRLPDGREGTIVHDFGDTYMVEISDDECGETLDLPTVKASEVVLVWKLGEPWREHSA